MYKISGIVSKQVIELAGARVLGTVMDVRFSPSMKRAESLLLLDEEENDETYLRLSVKSVSAVNETVVVRRLSAPLAACAEKSNSPLNRPCCNHEGKRLGVVTDVELDDDFTLAALCVGDKSYSADKLLAFSDSLVVLNDSDATVKLPRPRCRKPKASDRNAVVRIAAANASKELAPQEIYAQSGAAARTETAIGNHAPESVAGYSDFRSVREVPTPSRERGKAPSAADFSFLIGKRVTQALFSRSGELIAAENSVVTRLTVLDAARENRLVHLALRVL